MLKFWLPFWAISTLFALVSAAQHQDLREKPAIWNTGEPKPTDSTSLLSAFKSGKVSGHFRYFYSSTANQGSLTDYYAHALGGGLRFESGNFHGFSGAISGFYIFNLGSSDLQARDTETGALNRYEAGLFDITDPGQTREINRLEEFFIRYKKEGLKLTFGRQLMNTPFINLQDGRMRPTAAQGLVVDYSFAKNQQLMLSWIYGMAPRGTGRWYSLEESIGIYPVGVNRNGNKSEYAGNTSSQGALLANYKITSGAGLSIDIWNMWLENVMNTALIQIDGERKSGIFKIQYGVQGSWQIKSGNGGNPLPQMSFYDNTKPVYTAGFKVGMKTQKYTVTLNGNRISTGGRFLMPREWGRDFFYTFMPRERNEGFGDVWAVVFKTSAELSRSTEIRLDAGNFWLPDVRDYALNKYGMPSYFQLNADLRHKFTGFFQGMEAQLLWVYKWNTGDIYNDKKYLINKADMWLLNVVVNYRF